MESVQGSWQYETFSSANETSYSSSPSSPAMYNQMSPLADQGMWDDFSLTKGLDLQDPFIGCGGEQLLSATGNFVNALSPPRVFPKIEAEENPMLYVDPNMVQPQPPVSVGDADPVDLVADLEEFLGETLDFTTIVTTEQTEAQEYLNLQPEQLNEASVNLGSPIATDLKPVVNFEDLGTIDAADIIQEAELVAALGDEQAINLDEWIMDEEEEVQDETTSFETSYEDTSDSVMNDNSYLDSSSQMSSVLTSDAEDDAQEETIDALIRFDLPAAQAAIVNSNFAMPAVATFVVEQTKPERRGRKPSTTATASQSWRNVKDKSLRKKQQNKLAATKYRQKKKEEAMVSLVEENRLQAAYNKLAQEQQRLADKIRQVKELLKEKYNL